MKNVKKIIKLLVQILFKPKRVAGGRILGQYDINAMNKFIVFMSILYGGSFIFAKVKSVQHTQVYTLLVIVLASIVLIPVLILHIKKITIKYYGKAFINPYLEFPIPDQMLELMLTPYIAVSTILATILNLAKIYFPFLHKFSGLILTAWFSLQVYYLVLYRILPSQNITISGLYKITRKLASLVLFLFIMQSGIYFLEDEGIVSKPGRSKLNYEIPEIRVEVYEEAKSIFDEVEIAMTAGKGTTYEQEEALRLKRWNLIYFKIDHLRSNERKLLDATSDMVGLSNDWYEERRAENQTEAQELLIKYEQAVEEAEFFMKTYYKP